MRFNLEKNTVIGEMTSKIRTGLRIGKRGPLSRVSHLSQDMSNEDSPIGCGIKEEFFDEGNEQLLLCHAILDELALHDGKSIKTIFDKEVLKKSLHSHIYHIRKIANVL